MGRKKKKRKARKGIRRTARPPTLGGRGWLSWKGHRADALALGAEERRDKLRKAAGRGKYPRIRRYLNGATRAGRACAPVSESIAYRGEPGELKHLSSRRRRKQK